MKNTYYEINWSRVLFVKEKYHLTNKQFGNLVGVSESLVSGWVWGHTKSTRLKAYNKVMFLYKHSCSRFKPVFKFLVRFV